MFGKDIDEFLEDSERLRYELIIFNIIHFFTFLMLELLALIAMTGTCFLTSFWLPYLFGRLGLQDLLDRLVHL